jgi:Spy/CpxP family protein refolding chaperone
MKKLNAKLLVSAALVSGLATTTFAYAHDSGETGACGHMHHDAAFGGRGDLEARMERLADRLDLTADQHTAVRAIVDRTRPEMRGLRDKMAENRKQLQALTMQAGVDENQVRALADAQGKVFADMLVLRSKTRGEINKLLTDQQREKMQQMRGARGPHAG